MLIPEAVKKTLIELDRMINDFQVRKSIVAETLAHVAGITDKYKFIGQYDEIVDGVEEEVLSEERGGK